MPFKTSQVWSAVIGSVGRRGDVYNFGMHAARKLKKMLIKKKYVSITRQIEVKKFLYNNTISFVRPLLLSPLSFLSI
jgi:hypothetical protein